MNDKQTPRRHVRQDDPLHDMSMEMLGGFLAIVAGIVFAGVGLGIIFAVATR